MIIRQVLFACNFKGRRVKTILQCAFITFFLCSIWQLTPFNPKIQQLWIPSVYGGTVARRVRSPAIYLIDKGGTLLSSLATTTYINFINSNSIIYFYTLAGPKHTVTRRR
jgi:hypothetical protein